MAQEPANKYLPRLCVGKKNKYYDEHDYMVLGGCTSIRLVQDIVAASINMRNVSLSLNRKILKSH